MCELLMSSLFSKPTNTSKFQFDLETVGEEPPRANSYYYIIIIINHK